jgi:hypothetical protein
MVTPAPNLDTITVASAAIDVASTNLVAAITTVEATVASRDHAAGAVVAAGAPIGTVTSATALTWPTIRSAFPSPQPTRAPM